MRERNICALVEYDGSHYSGFQRQEEARTIEGEILKAIERLVGYQVEISAASRTDKGVHARGQVFNFHLQSPIPTSSLQRAINGLLPKDIVIRKAMEEELAFDARFCAKGKHYLYQILNQPTPSAFQRLYSLYVSYPIDQKRMERAGDLLLGERDFSSFEATGSTPRDPNCHLYEVKIERRDPLIIIHVVGDRFLYKMVRNIVGTLLEVGRGKIEAEEIPAILEARDRSKAGPTAKPQGLFLKKVFYSNIYPVCKGGIDNE